MGKKTHKESYVNDLLQDYEDYLTGEYKEFISGEEKRKMFVKYFDENIEFYEDMKKNYEDYVKNITEDELDKIMFKKLMKTNPDFIEDYQNDKEFFDLYTNSMYFRQKYNSYMAGGEQHLNAYGIFAGRVADQKEYDEDKEAYIKKHYKSEKEHDEEGFRIANETGKPYVKHFITGAHGIVKVTYKPGGGTQKDDGITQ